MKIERITTADNMTRGMMDEEERELKWIEFQTKKIYKLTGFSD